MEKVSRNNLRRKRHLRKKSNLRGTSERPRVTVFRSLNNIFLQLIDDSTGRTICSASTIMKDYKSSASKRANSVEAAKELATHFARRLKENKKNAVVFDRSGYKYHGKVKAIADTLRKAEIKF